MRVLILGGTGEARALAAELDGRGIAITTALAGVTRAPYVPRGCLRLGGFGGAQGLARYIEDMRVTALIDATHPFAAQISANAVRAAEMTGVTLIRLERPAWQPHEGASWHRVADIEAAIAAIAPGARALLTTGHEGLALLASRPDCRFWVRTIEPAGALPDHCSALPGRPPFALADETALMARLGIDHLVTKNAGGAQTRAKLDAARALGVRVIMIDRPILPPAPTVESVPDVLAVLEGLTGRTGSS